MAENAGTVTIRLWASARAAAGVDSVAIDVQGPVSVAWLAAETVRRAPADGPGREDPARLTRVLEVCSVLVGDQPLGAADRGEVKVDPGATIEFLPPFAGG